MRRFFLSLGTMLTAILLFFFISYNEQAVKAIVKTDTETILSVTPGSSVYGQPVTFIAVVRGNPPSWNIPRGEVIFDIISGSQTLHIPARLDDTGAAVLALNDLLPASYTVSAFYEGDDNFNTSRSNLVFPTVTPVSTATELSSSTNTSVYGQPVTFTATVTANPPSEIIPTGEVIFDISDYGSIVAMLDRSGKATVNVNTLHARPPYSIRSVYFGEGGFETSYSSEISLTVNKAPTTTSLTSSPNPSDIDQSVTFTATVTANPPSESTLAGKHVVFDIDSDSFGAVLDGSGKATLLYHGFSASGQHTAKARFEEDADFLASSTPPLTQNVRAETAFSLLSSKNPSNKTDPVTFTTSGLPSDATGNVKFFDGGTELGASMIFGGKAQFTVSSLSMGDHIITAQYSGNEVYAPSTSSDLIQTVNAFYIYTIRYIDIFSGESIAPDVQGAGRLGEKITVNASEIKGYLLQDSSSKTFTINAGNNIETFYYMSVPSVVFLVIIANIIVAVIVAIIIRNRS